MSLKSQAGTLLNRLSQVLFNFLGDYAFVLLGIYYWLRLKLCKVAC